MMQLLQCIACLVLLNYHEGLNLHEHVSGAAPRANTPREYRFATLARSDLRAIADRRAANLLKPVDQVNVRVGYAYAHRPATGWHDVDAAFSIDDAGEIRRLFSGESSNSVVSERHSMAINYRQWVALVSTQMGVGLLCNGSDSAAAAFTDTDGYIWRDRRLPSAFTSMMAADICRDTESMSLAGRPDALATTARAEWKTYHARLLYHARDCVDFIGFARS